MVNEFFLVASSSPTTPRYLFYSCALFIYPLASFLIFSSPPASFLRLLVKRIDSQVLRPSMMN